MVKNPPASQGDTRDSVSIPGSGRSPGEGNGNPLQYSWMGNPMDRGAWWAMVHRVTKSWTHRRDLASMHTPHVHICIYICTYSIPSNSTSKESACNAGDAGSIPRPGRCPGEGIDYPLQYSRASLVAQMVKNLPPMQETWVLSLGWGDPLEKGTGNPLQYSCLENPHGVAKSGTQLND